MSDNPLLVNMDEKNKYEGTLFIESYDSLIDSITGQAQSELDLAFNAIGAVASTVSLVVDPFGSLLGSAFGWMMEHISILKELLDEVLGDPEDIQANVEATKAKAAELRVLAEDHRRSLATFDGWTGAASEKFQTSMDTMGKELDSLAGAVEGKAKVVAMMGTIVSVLRDIIMRPDCTCCGRQWCWTPGLMRSLVRSASTVWTPWPTRSSSSSSARSSRQRNGRRSRTSTRTPTGRTRSVANR
ncbi:hypothetical protein C8D88_110284 [Lentzea atacamensis]|uniref:WXG100 family type VII secretion target n=1 Tax=Lentzea atacamensis TaxID=531938 RepID=A0A316HUS3_9PSEU|nr:hypothetical protein [Lentzea atacamensis]PWK83828.1 hypothetical protein C8D88_110284 [Lentzea atacamensis]